MEVTSDELRASCRRSLDGWQARFRAALPRASRFRVRVVGSVATGTSVAGSDMDIILVFQCPLPPSKLLRECIRSVSPDATFSSAAAHLCLDPVSVDVLIATPAVSSGAYLIHQWDSQEPRLSDNQAAIDRFNSYARTVPAIRQVVRCLKVLLNRAWNAQVSPKFHLTSHAMEVLCLEIAAAGWPSNASSLHALVIIALRRLRDHASSQSPWRPLTSDKHDMLAARVNPSVRAAFLCMLITLEGLPSQRLHELIWRTEEDYSRSPCQLPCCPISLNPIKGRLETK